MVRADYFVRHEGRIIVAVSAVEVAPLQADGWLYIIDHATGASIASAWADDASDGLNAAELLRASGAPIPYGQPQSTRETPTEGRGSLHPPRTAAN
jgi:hypothetical protein